jgi:hypothetical protein
VCTSSIQHRRHTVILYTTATKNVIHSHLSTDHYRICRQHNTTHKYLIQYLLASTEDTRTVRYVLLRIDIVGRAG